MAAPKKADPRGTAYINDDNQVQYFTDETVKVAGDQGMKGWRKASAAEVKESAEPTEAPEPLKED